MFLIIHGPVGALIGQYVANPLLAFILGIASHFVLDIIPHGDDTLSQKVGSGYWRRVSVAVVDGFFTVLLLLAFYHAGSYQPSIIWGSIGGMLPDFMWGVPELLKRKTFNWFIRFHSKNHMLIKKRLSFWKGMALQAIVILGLLWIIQ